MFPSGRISDGVQERNNWNKTEAGGVEQQEVVDAKAVEYYFASDAR